MKQTGIWLDKDKAYIVSLENENETFETVSSNIEHFNITANKTIGGAKEVAIDRKYLEREKHQIKAYFKSIVSEIRNANAIAIFGPAQMPEEFKKELDQNYNTISAKVKGVLKADSMTDNQVKALVRDFFKSK